MTVELTINGRPHVAPDGQAIIEACRDAGADVPRFCYHPGLSIGGSCRMCMVEIEGQPKLAISCQTPVAPGIHVLTETERVRSARAAVMEFLLINHPLDCPVCDQAGECYLQDYSVRHGRPASRFVEAKIKQPKKDVGRHILLYMDRCVLCSRCVRFTREISGTAELAVVGRGAASEIDIFPGRPLDNRLSGCVADICPVGALLDKHFLHRQRAWLLNATPSVCARCSAGCNINIFHNDGLIWRLKPRENRRVNDWWMCDDGRYGWDYVHADRLNHRPRVRRGTAWEELDHGDAAEVIAYRLREVATRHGPGSVAAVLSPMWTSEEQFLLATLVRAIDPQAVLALGPVPVVGQDETFKAGFTIRAEKCPNRRGAERVLAALAGPRMTFESLIDAAGAKIKALWLAGGYPPDLAWPEGPGRWLASSQAKALASPGLTLVADDLFGQDAYSAAAIMLAGAAWAEKSGTFVNAGGLVQRIDAAPVGPRGILPEADLLWAMSGRAGPPDLSAIWSMMSQAGVEGYTPLPLGEGGLQAG